MARAIAASLDDVRAPPASSPPAFAPPASAPDVSDPPLSRGASAVVSPWSVAVLAEGETPLEGGFETPLGSLDEAEVAALAHAAEASAASGDVGLAAAGGDALDFARALRAAHRASVEAWLAERPGRHGQPPTGALCSLLCRVGVPDGDATRWALWLRSLGVYSMPSLSSQSATIRSLLETELIGQRQLEADAHAALVAALGAACAQRLPAGVLEQLTRELCFLMLVLLKRVRQRRELM